MPRLVLSLVLAACVPPGPAGPAADPPPAATAPQDRPQGPAASTGARCLDLRGAPRRRLQQGPDGSLWLERWTRRPEPRGELVRVDPETGSEEQVLSDIFSADVVGEHLVAARALGDDRSVLRGRRGLFLAGLDGAGERPLTPPEHAVASYALARDAAVYTTPDGALYRRPFAADRPEQLADGVAAVHAAWSSGDLLVGLADARALALRSPDGTLRPLDLAGDVTLTKRHVLIDSPSGAWALRDGAALRLPPGLRALPGALARSQGAGDVLHELDGRALAPLAAVAGAAVVEVVPVPGAIWSLVLHDTDGDGVRRPLADEADLCRIDRGADVQLPARDRPRRLDRSPAAFAALAGGDLSGGTSSIESGALVLRAPGAGPTTHAELRARAAALHRAAAAIAGGHDHDLLVEWAGNHRHASVSWDSRLARPVIHAGGHGRSIADAPVEVDVALDLEPLPDGRRRVVCRGRARHDAALPRTLELRCTADLRPGLPLATASQVLEDMPSQTDIPFAVDLGVHALAPTAISAALFDGPRELPAASRRALADADDFLAALDRAAALGFTPAPGREHALAQLAAPPEFAALPARERAARAAALWEILAAHADRHHHGRLAPVHLAGTAHTIRRGRLE